LFVIILLQNATHFNDGIFCCAGNKQSQFNSIKIPPGFLQAVIFMELALNSSLLSYSRSASISAA